MIGLVKMGHIFRLAELSDVDAVFQLYRKRIYWMNKKGIRQWNVTGYLDAYSIDYYMMQQALGNLYVLEENNTVIGAVVLLQADERWNEKTDVSAFYLHNLVTDTEVSGAGVKILLEVEKIAKKLAKRFVRLDCAVDNDFLNDYYSSLGYEIVGTCQEGTYIGTLREKTII